MIMGHLQNLITWAKAQGVVVRGIEPSSIPGRGTGILATRKIKVNSGPVGCLTRTWMGLTFFLAQKNRLKKRS